MTTGITHTTPADGSFSAAGAINWNDIHLLTESGGQALTFGAITNGQYLKRSGTVITSGTPPTTSDLFYAAAPNTDFDLTNGGGGGNVNFVSQSITGVIAGDQLLIDLWFTIMNNSLASRTYTPTIVLGGFTLINAGATGTITASATNRFTFRQTVMFSVSSTSLAYGMVSGSGQGGTGSAGGTAIGLATSATSPQGWNSIASDMTGTNTFTSGYTSSSTTTTQTLTLHSINIRKISAT